MISVDLDLNRFVVSYLLLVEGASCEQELERATSFARGAVNGLLTIRLISPEECAVQEQYIVRKALDRRNALAGARLLARGIAP